MGYILIPIGLILIFSKIEYILLFVVFFSGFSNSGVINFLNIGSLDFTLTAPYYFAFILIIKFTLMFVVKIDSITKPDAILTLFILICCISIFMPLLLEKENIYVTNASSRLSTVKWSIQNITQLSYLLFSFSAYWIAKDIICKKPYLIEKCLNIYFCGAFAICLIGYYQVVAYYLGLPFDEIFRHSTIGTVQGSRVYAVTNEPSMLAFYLSPTLALLIFYKVKGLFISKKILIIMLFILSILSTSTTFLLCIVIFYLLFVSKAFFKWEFSKQNLKLINRFILTTIIAILCFIPLFFISYTYSILEYMFRIAFEKITLNHVSGIERLGSINLLFEAFLKSPILGIGFGSSRGTALFTTWLANTGISGIALFSIFCIRLYIKLNKSLKYENKQFALSEGYMYFLVLLILSMFVSVPEPYYLFIWINFAIMEVYIKKIMHNSHIHHQA